MIRFILGTRCLKRWIRSLLILLILSLVAKYALWSVIQEPENTYHKIDRNNDFHAGNGFAERENIYLAILLHNNEQIIPNFIQNVLSKILPHVNVYLSIMENGSEDLTKNLLLNFHRELQKIESDNSNPFIKLARCIGLGESGKSFEYRIEYLSQLRNLAMVDFYRLSMGYESDKEVLRAKTEYHQRHLIYPPPSLQNTSSIHYYRSAQQFNRPEYWPKFDYFVFMNDVIFDANVLVNDILLGKKLSKLENWDAICAMDYDPLFYDTLVTREYGGSSARQIQNLLARISSADSSLSSEFLDQEISKLLGVPPSAYPPHFFMDTNRHAFHNQIPVPVWSCWNGLVVLKAKELMITSSNFPKIWFRSLVSDRSSERGGAGLPANCTNPEPEWKKWWESLKQPRSTLDLPAKASEKPLSFGKITKDLRSFDIEASESCLIFADFHFWSREAETDGNDFKVYVYPKLKTYYEFPYGIRHWIVGLFLTFVGWLKSDPVRSKYQIAKIFVEPSDSQVSRRNIAWERAEKAVLNISQKNLSPGSNSFYETLDQRAFLDWNCIVSA